MEYLVGVGVRLGKKGKVDSVGEKGERIREGERD